MAGNFYCEFCYPVSWK